MSTTTNQKPGTPINKSAKSHDRYFTRGSLMFIEGEMSREMFIIRSGKVRILKLEGDKTIELAVLGAGSVLGELSLLDSQPRSATAQVIEDLHVSVIDEKAFNHALEDIPGWLSTIIQIIVSRLRDTLKKTSETVVHKSVAGVVRVMLLIGSHDAVHETQKEKKIPILTAKEVISSTIGLGDVETEQVFLHLILKELMTIQKNNTGLEFVVIKDIEVMELYMNFLRALQCGSKLLGQSLSDGAIELVELIMNLGSRIGKKIKNEIYSVSISQIELELQRQEKGRYIDLDALDELLDSKVLVSEQRITKTDFHTLKQGMILYNESIVKKVILLHLWLPKFQEEITL